MKPRSENRLADVFFEQCKTKDPQRYAAIAKSYPILTTKQMDTINQRETRIDELSSDDAEAVGVSFSYEEN